MSVTPSMPVRYLSVDEVWAINETVHAQEGHSAFLRDRDALDGALMRPQSAAYYQEADLITQAAILIAAIALAHAFLDGNKRTALIAGVVFLDLNGVVVDAAPGDDALGRQVEAFVTDHEDADSAIERLYGWLRSHATSRP